MKAFIKNIIACSLALVLLAPSASEAIFNPNFILGDRDLVDSTSMSVDRVQSFLQSQGSGLASYVTDAPGGLRKTAAQVIYEAGRYWGINQRYLMVRMQVEQSLVTDSTPSERQLNWATGYAVCDSCSTSDPAIQQYRGFFNQVNWAARRIRERYLPDLAQNGVTFTGWGPGKTKKTGDGYFVTPENNATSVMYTYTPYVYNANYNVWRFWNTWFIRHYPDGSLLQDSASGGIWKIENGKRRPFQSRSAFFSRYDANQAIPVSKTDLEAYNIGAPIKFPNYALVLSSNGKVYLLDGDSKRWIVSPEVFRAIGFNPEEIITVSDSDLATYTNGEPVSLQSAYPSGVLFQSLQTGGISFIKDGVRHSVWSREILNSQFKNRSVATVNDEVIQRFAKGDPILFRDSELVTSPGNRSVFFISNGIKRPIASKEAFDALGFRWENIIRTSDKALEIHPTGSQIKLE
ncbi:MAG TPA: hypothetical protein DHV25_01920 [Candidatus Kerfeldbacteria bacterium]|nr:hypothetical protein [Candidatus Kerfeldbacteria bacterium]